MAEWRVANVMSKSGCFDHLNIELVLFRQLALSCQEMLCESLGGLSDLKGMRQPIVKYVTLGSVNHLSNAREAPEG